MAKEKLNRFVKKIICVSMAAVMTMSFVACGKKETQPAPDLLEPVSTNEAYRPVFYGDVGRKVIKNGSVVPTDYCHFFKTATNISKIYVNVGDYVKKGEKLIECDVEEGESSLSEMKDSLSSRQTEHSIRQKIFNEQQKEYDYKIKACEEFGDAEGAAEYRKEKAVEAENNRYDNVLYDRETARLQTQIEEAESLQTNNTLEATHSGYVTYVKDISEDTSIGGGENAVIISDYDDPYIEIYGEKISKDAYSVFNNMYTIVDGKKYDIELFSYTNEELAAAQSVAKLPFVRFKIKGGDNKKLLTTGTTLPLYFSTSSAVNVLVIGKDSLYQEGEQNFVYVKSENKEKEKREIQIGETDDNYIEVVSGLKEGELVFYDSDSMIPSTYTSYEVALSDFKKVSSSKKYSLDDLNTVLYTSPVGGYFQTFDVQKGDSVKKGDLLFVVDSGGGSAELLEINAQIEDAKEQYDDAVDAANERIDELKKQIADNKKKQEDKGDNDKKKKDETASPGDPEKPEENTLYLEEQLTCEINIEEYNKELAKCTYNATVNPLIAKRDKLNENNDGNGNISVYAESDGVIQQVYQTMGYALNEGDKVLSIGSSEEKMMSTALESENSNSEGDDSSKRLLINQTVTLISNSDEGTKYTGTCIGTTADSTRAYITTDADGKVYVTSNSGSSLRYYISVKEKEFYETPKGYKISYASLYLENIVTIPKNLLYHEVEKQTGREYDYVWKIVGDEMVKQYVTKGAEESSTAYYILSGIKEGDILAKETSE